MLGHVHWPRREGVQQGERWSFSSKLRVRERNGEVVVLGLATGASRWG
jgi:hypothetical protein